MRSELLRKLRWLVLTLGVVTLFGGSAKPADASHFRYGTVSWKPTGSPGEVDFRLTAAFRRTGFSGTASDGYPQTGDVFTENVGPTKFQFGDGAADTPNLQFKVTSFSVTENWILAEALHPGTSNVGVRHTYSTGGPFFAGIESGSRISMNNRSNSDYRVKAEVRLGSGNHSPVTSLTPTVVVQENAAATFEVSASDGDATAQDNTLRYRFATDTEAGGGPLRRICRSTRTRAWSPGTTWDWIRPASGRTRSSLKKSLRTTR